MMVFDILRYIIGTYVTNKVSNAFDDIYITKVFKVLACYLGHPGISKNLSMPLSLPGVASLLNSSARWVQVTSSHAQSTLIKMWTCFL